ncbi:hypothetical protein LOAG_08704 [Loa loa]|uniref:Uncharacterized protein n=1 Tax=Loa loa TaxID=7209 RepID=A0A1S0TUW1_LOALO|nr:hypothetical protein LOAG_08704 [Loa loa]EFO19791.2 hypothetical protein LOAG_08704 [Loa loa]
MPPYSTITATFIIIITIMSINTSSLSSSSPPSLLPVSFILAGIETQIPLLTFSTTASYHLINLNHITYINS